MSGKKELSLGFGYVDKLCKLSREHNIKFENLDSLHTNGGLRFIGAEMFPRLTRLVVHCDGFYSEEFEIPTNDIFRNLKHLKLKGRSSDSLKPCPGWSTSENALRNLEILELECGFVKKEDAANFASTLSSLRELKLAGGALRFGDELIEGLHETEAPLQLFAHTSNDHRNNPEYAHDVRCVICSCRISNVFFVFVD